MRKALVAILAAAVAVTVWLAWARSHTPLVQNMFIDKADPEGRVAQARHNRARIVADRYHAAGVLYPAEIFLRWFKKEAVLELWARNPKGRFRRVASYPILAPSGQPGPKRKEGDRQVPEGFYEIDRLNPESSFHLSLGLNYPNPADLVHADPQQPGSDIFIHGGNQSIGCAPIGDDAIEELYLAAADARAAGQQRIPVHVFPGRMNDPAWASFARDEAQRRPDLADFWEQLRPGYEAFERQHVVPAIEITTDGTYRVKAEH